MEHMNGFVTQGAGPHAAIAGLGAANSTTRDVISNDARSATGNS
jgi:hypothetical protein